MQIDELSNHAETERLKVDGRELLGGCNRERKTSLALRIPTHLDLPVPRRAAAGTGSGTLQAHRA